MFRYRQTARKSTGALGPRRASKCNCKTSFLPLIMVSNLIHLVSQNYDMFLIADGRRVPANVEVISKSSNVLRNKIESQDTTEIILEGISYQALTALVEYLHTDFLGLPEAMILMELLLAGEKYEIDLKKICIDTLMRVIKIEDAVQVYKSAEKLKQDHLVEVLIEKLHDYLRENESEIMKTDGFKSLDTDARKVLREKWLDEIECLD